MKRSLLALAAALALVPGTLLAQQRIGFGEVRGTLTTTSPKAGDGTPYVLYEYHGNPGERVLIDMLSEDFDAFLMVGSNVLPDCGDGCRRDDDGGDNYNSRMIATVPDTGRLQILANAVSDEATGRFTLKLAAAPRLAAPKQTALAVPGQAEAELTVVTARDDESIPYDVWVLRGAPNTHVVIDMRSEEFDAMLAVQPGAPGSTFNPTATDDDGGSNTNARLRIQLGADGMATVRARSHDDSAVGRYTLVTRTVRDLSNAVVRPLAPGDSIRATLSPSDDYDDASGRYVHIYRITGRPGERILVQMESSEVDSLLRWGYIDGGVFEQDMQDDDSGESRNARLIVTLDADGNGRLQATTSGEDETGTYQLIVVKAPRKR